MPATAIVAMAAAMANAQAATILAHPTAPAVVKAGAMVAIIAATANARVVITRNQPVAKRTATVQTVIMRRVRRALIRANNRRMAADVVKTAAIVIGVKHRATAKLVVAVPLVAICNANPRFTSARPS